MVKWVMMIVLIKPLVRKGRVILLLSLKRYSSFFFFPNFDFFFVILADLGFIITWNIPHWWHFFFCFGHSASIIVYALPGFIDLNEIYKIWKVDKLDFLACIGAFVGVLFAFVEIGLLAAVINFLSYKLIEVKLYLFFYQMI